MWNQHWCSDAFMNIFEQLELFLTTSNILLNYNLSYFLYAHDNKEWEQIIIESETKWCIRMSLHMASFELYYRNEDAINLTQRIAIWYGIGFKLHQYKSKVTFRKVFLVSTSSKGRSFQPINFGRKLKICNNNQIK